MTRSEVAQALGVSVSMVRKLERAGTLNPVQVEGRWQHSRDEVDGLIAKRENAGQPTTTEERDDQRQAAEFEAWHAQMMRRYEREDRERYEQQENEERERRQRERDRQLEDVLAQLREQRRADRQRELERAERASDAWMLVATSLALGGAACLFREQRVPSRDQADLVKVNAILAMFEHDEHHNFQGDNLSKALLTVAQIMGSTATEIGIDAGRVTEPLAGLQA